MSLYGSWKAATIAAQSKTSAEINLNRDYEYLEVIIPTITSGTLKLQVAEAPGGTFQDLGLDVTTNTTTGGYSDTWKLGGYQFVKVVSSVTQEADRLIRVRGRER